MADRSQTWTNVHFHCHSIHCHSLFRLRCRLLKQHDCLKESQEKRKRINDCFTKTSLHITLACNLSSKANDHGPVLQRGITLSDGLIAIHQISVNKKRCAIHWIPVLSKVSEQDTEVMHLWVDYVGKNGNNTNACRWNPSVLLFKWKLLSGDFIWYDYIWSINGY